MKKVVHHYLLLVVSLLTSQTIIPAAAHNAPQEKIAVYFFVDKQTPESLHHFSLPNTASGKDLLDGCRKVLSAGQTTAQLKKITLDQIHIATNPPLDGRKFSRVITGTDNLELSKAPLTTQENLIKRTKISKLTSPVYNSKEEVEEGAYEERNVRVLFAMIDKNATPTETPDSAASSSSSVAANTAASAGK